MIVKTGTVDGKQIEVHNEGWGLRRYWAKVGGTALFQRGRMRLRTFDTPDAAWKAALRAASQTAN